MKLEEAQRDRKAMDIFARAVEFAGREAQMDYLELACGGDEVLKASVQALLANHVEDTCLQKPAAVLGPGDMLVTLLSEQPGDLIGRYKLLEKLGEGGFGAVWAAEQKEPVRRRVALKIIKLGMDTKQVVARFEAERQALALMDHPNIAKVLDAGGTATGRPYFVMELVKGIPITKYCDQEKLGTNERLDLFMKVCQAIQHAHQKGIIHRDIKPSNILVTLHDGVPVPKVIDFGIAKATQAELTEKTIYTQYSQFIGTRAYMSPEQAEMSRLDIDTRSDIYSLGVLLYELLTGTTPFESQELLRMGLEEMRRIIQEREPVRPSTRLSQTRSREEGSGPVTRASSLASDLDWIVMKCLEKDRTRRYETANGLAADLKRFLGNEPIVARPPSRVYKAAKFVRRNRIAVTAGTAVLLALLAGLGATTVMVSSLKRLNRELLAAQARARQAELSRVFDSAMFAALSGDNKAMNEALEEARTNGISGGQISFLKGLHSTASGRPGEAVEYLKEAIRSWTNSVAAHALLATAMVYAQQYENHLAILKKLRHLKEETFEDYLFKGQALGFEDPASALVLLDQAVAMKPTALAYMLRAEARAMSAANLGSTNDIELALKDIADAKAKASSQDNVTLLVNSCLTHIFAAGTYRRAGNLEQMRKNLEAADKDGAALERLSENPHAARWRIWQLEIAGREDGPGGSFEYLQRLQREQKVRHPQIQLSYGTALLRKGKVREALAAFESVPLNNIWTTSMRLIALFELPERREEFETEVAKLPEDGWAFLLETKAMFLLYAGRAEEARALATKMADRPEYSSSLPLFDQRILIYLAGRCGEDEFINAAQGVLTELASAQCLVGFQHWAEGDREGANGHFQRSIDTGVFTGPPYHWSKVALAQLERYPTWPPPQKDASSASSR